MIREHVESLLKIAGDMWVSSDDIHQAEFFNNAGKQWKIVKRMHGWSVEQQLCAAVGRMTPDALELLIELGEFAEMKKETTD